MDSAPIGVELRPATPKAARNAGIRSGDIPKKQAPSPSSTTVSSISSAANPVSMSQ